LHSLWFHLVLISCINYGPKKVINLKILTGFIVIKTEEMDRKEEHLPMIMEEAKKKGNLVALVKDQVINKINEDKKIKVHLNKKLM